MSEPDSFSGSTGRSNHDAQITGTPSANDRLAR